jgi:hypothetical protein
MFSSKNVVTARKRTSRVLVAASLALSMLLPAGNVFAAGTPELSWIRQFGTATASNEAARAVDDDGNTFVAGTTDGVLSGQSSAGGTDGWIRKYDRHGNLLFVEQFGTSGDDVVTGVAIEQTGIHVVGYTNATFAGQTSAGGVDIFVRKYDPGLEPQHTSMLQFGTDGDDYALGADGEQAGSLIAGKTSGAFPGKTNIGGFDAFTARLGSDLSIRWIDQWGSDADDWATGVDFGASTEVVVSGATAGTLPDQVSAGGTDAFMRRIDVTTGNENLTVQFGTAQYDEANAAANSLEEDAVVAGTTYGSMPGFTNAGGADTFLRGFPINIGASPEWLTQFGTSGDDIVSGAAFAGNRLTYVSGTTTGALPNYTNAGGTDAFLLQYYSYDGQLRWYTQFGTAFDDAARAVGLDPTLHHIFAMGETLGALPGQTNSGGSDAFVVKYKQDNDGDGIYNEVDIAPDDFTNEFSDAMLHEGTTIGTVVDRADQNLIIVDSDEEESAAGIVIEAKLGDAEEPADVSMCNGLAESQLESGDAIEVLCGSAHIGVKSGSVDTTFVAPDGITTTTSYDVGNTLAFDGYSAFTAAEANPDEITVNIGSTEQVIGPGRTIRLITLTQDAFLREGKSNTNEGINPMLLVRKKGDIRSLVGFDLAGQNLSGLQKATLVLTIGSMPPSNWKNGGSPIEVRRLLSSWSEGNGKDLDVPEADSTRGNGPGVTWKCATDSEIANTEKDCNGNWDGGDASVAPRTAPTMTITNGMSGEVSFDVTQDVLAGANNGWLIQKTHENHSGNIKFYSKEGAVGDLSLAPKLILEFEN